MDRPPAAPRRSSSADSPVRRRRPVSAVCSILSRWPRRRCGTELRSGERIGVPLLRPHAGAAITVTSGDSRSSLPRGPARSTPTRGHANCFHGSTAHPASVDYEGRGTAIKSMQRWRRASHRASPTSMARAARAPPGRGAVRVRRQDIGAASGSRRLSPLDLVDRSAGRGVSRRHGSMHPPCRRRDTDQAGHPLRRQGGL